MLLLNLSAYCLPVIFWLPLARLLSSHWSVQRYHNREKADHGVKRRASVL